MKKETVIRQNRCDQEMNLLLFGCFFIFMALQVFVNEYENTALISNLNMMLYFVFAPGFIFRMGYCFIQDVRNDSTEEVKNKLLKNAGRYFVYFGVLSFMYHLCCVKDDMRVVVSRIFTARVMPSVSVIFFSLAFLCILVWVLYDHVFALAGKHKKMVILGVVCILCAFLRSETNLYGLLAALVGTDFRHTVPIVPYFVYFILGMWAGERKPGFQLKLVLVSAVVTGASFLVYHTPLEDLCRVTISLLPVYAVYVVSEGMSDLSLRFKPVRFLCETVEGVFCLYTVLLFGLRFLNKVPTGNIKIALVLACGLLCFVYAGIAGFLVFQKVYTWGAERFCTKIKHKNAAYFSIYTVAFAVLLFLCFIDYPRFDKTLLWKQDAVSQYYPRAIYYINYIRDLFSSIMSGTFELPMYDFSLGLGGEITYSLEPLYFLFAIFGEEHAEFAYSFLVLLRFYVAGITSSIMFRYFKKDYFTTFIASIVYVFCGFALYGGARHYMFMVPMIMLPLLVIAVEEILRHKKWYLCTLFVALSLFSNYYYLYMNTLGLVIYFFVRFFCFKEKEKRSFKNFMSYVGIVSGSYLLGVAMSCIVLVTTFGLYVGSGRSGEMLIKTPSLVFYKASWLVRCFMSFLTTANSPGNWLKFGFLPISYVAIVVLFLRKGRKELKILSIISVFMCAFPVVGLVFNGFSSVSNRWCYLLALLIAYIVAECLPDMLRLDRREIHICGIAVLFYGYMAFLGDVMRTKYTKLAFFCLVITYLVILLCQENVKQWSKYTKQCMIIALTFVMVLHSGHTLYSTGGALKEYTSPGEADDAIDNTPLLAVSELNDDSFYRVTTPKLNYWTISSSLVHDYNSITMFNSTFNGSITEYLEKMGTAGYSVTQLYGFTNRSYMNSLASVKYYAYYKGKDEGIPYGYEEVLETKLKKKTAIVSEDKNALPIGYTYDHVITEEELESYDVVDRQEVMMQTAVVAADAQTGGVSHADLNDILTTKEELELISVEEAGIVLTDNALTSIKKEVETEVAEEDSENGSDNENSDEALQELEEEIPKYAITLQFEGKPNSETYLVFEQGVLEGNMSEKPIYMDFETEENTFSYKFRANDDRYGSRQEDYVFNLGYSEDGISSCTITFNRVASIQFDSLKLYSVPMDHMDTYCDTLKENVLENVVLDTNQVSGTVNLNEDKLLVLSIPYQNGWTAYVDGQPAQLLRTNYMYMGIPLSEGEHTIQLKFEIPGVKYALVIMPAAVVLFIVLCLVSVIRRKRKEKVNADTKEKSHNS